MKAFGRSILGRLGHEIRVPTGGKVQLTCAARCCGRVHESQRLRPATIDTDIPSMPENRPVHEFNHGRGIPIAVVPGVPLLPVIAVLFRLAALLARAASRMHGRAGCYLPSCGEAQTKSHAFHKFTRVDAPRLGIFPPEREVLSASHPNNWHTCGYFLPQARCKLISVQVSLTRKLALGKLPRNIFPHQDLKIGPSPQLHAAGAP
jgi:hypothetical protein